jgi:hypothetical protein
VEEEIPPSWQVENHLMTADVDSEAEPPLLSPHRLSDEHLQIIFYMRQKLDDQTHNQHILASEWTSCLMP